MTDLSRRAIVGGAGLMALTAALPLRALAQGAASAGATPGPEWNLADIYPSDAAWAAEREAVIKLMPSLGAWKGQLASSPASLKTALDAIYAAQNRADRLYLYAHLAADADTHDGANQARQGQAIELETEMGTATSWLSPEIVRMGAEKIAAFEAAEPGLGIYKHQLDKILRQAPHTLGDEAESVLAAASTIEDAPTEIRTQLADGEIPWPTVPLSTGPVRVDNQVFTKVREASNRADRKAAFEGFFGEYADFKGTLGASLTGHVQGHIFEAKARHYSSALEAALSPNAIPTTVYHMLIEQAHAGVPALQRYFELRKRLMKLDELHYYDLYPSITSLDRKFSLGDMRTLTLQAVTPLGPAYQKTLADATAGRWMDPWPRPGKVSGAYTDGVYGVHPYLLLNLYEDYNSLTTYAHEWGHAMHSVLANAAQPLPEADYTIFTAEIASTNNEQLLNHLMVTQAKTPAEKVFYLDQLLELFKGTFYRQTQFAEFELAIHEAAERGEGLSGDKFSEIYLKILKTYYEPAVKIDDIYAIEWAYIPHFFYDFYVYQYATCVAASAFFSDRTLAGGVKERESYLDVLRAGGADYPVDVLKRAGIDMTSPAPYQALVAKFNRTLDQIEEELKKM
jgi:oligoendopeptidase F